MGDDFDAAIAEAKAADSVSQTFSTTTQGLFFVFSAAVVAVPMRLYLTPMFDLSLTEHAPFFAGTTLVAAVLLWMAVVSVAASKSSSLSKERGVGVGGIKRKRNKKGKKTETASKSEEKAVQEAKEARIAKE